MDNSVNTFYNKEDNPNYHLKYDQEHGTRLDFIVKRFNLENLSGFKMADFGCGYGNLFKRINPDNEFYGFDGADIDKEKLLCKFEDFKKVDLNTEFANGENLYDMSFCFEVLEHLENPYRCLFEIKKLTQENGLVYLSVPDHSVTHNTIYPTLIYPHQNFELFLKQMALHPIDYVLIEEGWKTHVWLCKNEPWVNAHFVFPKHESKFRGVNPVEATNI